MKGETAMEEPKDKQKLEGFKLDHDTYKHLTTLSTGAILILATFLEKFFQQPKYKFLVGVTLVSLIISTIGSVFAMVGISDEVTTWKDSASFKIKGLIIVSSYGGFLLGMASFVVFTLMNFY
jgi:hypothetical protein